MTRILSIAALTILTLAIGLISCARPEWISDENEILKALVSHELLAILGVIVTITLASAASLHLELNRLEDSFSESFEEARFATKAYAYLLITLFAGALVLVTLKPLLATDSHWQAAFNGAAIWIIALNILAWLDLTSAVFAIPPDRKLKK